MEELCAKIHRAFNESTLDLFNAKKAIAEIENIITSFNKEVSKYNKAQLRLLKIYQCKCKYAEIDICYDINTALSLCERAYSVIYVADIDIYAITKNQTQHENFINIDIQSFDDVKFEEQTSNIEENERMPEPQDRIYQIILGNAEQHPLIIFHKKKDGTKIDDEISLRLRDLGNFFSCKVEATEYADKIQYSVDKKYKNYAECLADINRFLAARTRNTVPVYEEMPAPIAHMTDNYNVISYLKYGIVRAASSKEYIPSQPIQQIKINNLYVINNTQGSVNIDNKNNKNVKKFATAEQIRNWVANYPPSANTKRKEYFEKAKSEIGPIRAVDFSNIVQETYHEKRVDGSHYWRKNK